MCGEKRVFLSRVTDEFGRIAEDISRGCSFSAIEVCDQNEPPQRESGEKAEITVEKLASWINSSDYVVLLVGESSGSAHKIPESELDRNNLKNVLTQSQLQTYESLSSEFTKHDLGMDALTYTQLEGVLAIGAGKAPYVLQFSATTTRSDSSQEAYREWLRHYYLQGRDRLMIHRTDPHDMEPVRQALDDLLVRIDHSVQLQYILLGEPSSTLWGRVRETLNATRFDSQNKQGHLDRFSLEIRNAADEEFITVDWLEDVQDVGPAPRYLYAAVDGSNRYWFDHSMAVMKVANGSNELQRACVQRRNIAIRAVCFHGGKYFLLVQDPQDANLKFGPIEVVDNGLEFNSRPVSGVNVCDTDPVSLWHENGGFSFQYKQTIYSLEEADNGGYIANREDTNQAAPLSASYRSAYTLRFPKHLFFPFRRGFSGLTYDFASDDSGQQSWALVQDENANLRFLSLKRGTLLDAFQTADVQLEGQWCVLPWPCTVETGDKNTRLVLLKLGKREPNINRFREVVMIPLFLVRGGPNTNVERKWCKERVTRETKIPRLVTLIDGSEPLHHVHAEGQNAASSFCFILRDVIETRTRIRVWIIPRKFSTERLKYLDELLGGLRTLPPPPIKSTCRGWDQLLAGPGGLDEWWSLLLDCSNQ